jgi:uroporphyrinogen decarboxylase
MMTSKERVQKTIRHEEPDRVPTGEWGIDHDHVSRLIGRRTFWRNRRATTLALWEGRRDEVVEGLKRDCAALVERLDPDVITVELVPPKAHTHQDPPKRISEGIWGDSAGRIYKYAASNDSIQCITPTEGKEVLDDEDIRLAYESVEQLDDSVFELVDFIGDRYGREKAVMFRDIDIYDSLMRPFGGDYSHQLIIPTIEPDEVEKMYGPAFAYNQKLISHCAEHDVLIAMQGHDFGMNTGCIISPSILRTVFFPFMSMVNREIERHGMIPFFHCCGNIWEIIDQYIESGYKGYQSIQMTAGMDWKSMKERYGRQITIWTGVQCETLVNGTMEQTISEVRQALRDLMPGGGFIFGSTNSIQFGAKTENYMKALETVKEYGAYE